MAPFRLFRSTPDGPTESRLSDWLLAVVREYEYPPEIGYRAIKIAARACHAVDVDDGMSDSWLTLVAACLWIAIKVYVDEDVPGAREIARIADDLTTARSIARTEIEVCKALHWRV